MENLAGLIKKASILTEAFPYLVKFRGSTIVIKYGGSVFEQGKKDFLLRDVVLLKYLGLRPVIVHGGGPMITEMLEKLNIPTRFIDGLRVTDEATMEVIEMVLSGKINSSIVTQLNLFGGTAAGLSGVDLNLIEVETLQNEHHDYGYIGEITKVNSSYLLKLIEDGIIPVISPVSADLNGRAHNVNADAAAQAIASALLAEKLVYITDVDGLLDGEKKLITSVTATQAEKLLTEQIITAGMIPKIKFCLRAIKEGVRQVHILNGNISGVLLLELFTADGVGTMISR